jgi:hypothetical protein
MISMELWPQAKKKRKGKRKERCLKGIIADLYGVYPLSPDVSAISAINEGIGTKKSLSVSMFL